MPAFHEALIGGVRITYTIERDGTLLLALSDLAPSDPAAARALLARVAEAVGRRVRTLLADAPDAPWILEDGEVWELQRWEPFVGWGSTFPGHLYPTDPARWCQRSCCKGGKSVQDGFAAEGWRLDPSAVTADGWSYAVVPPMLRPWPSDVSPVHRWVRWRRWVPDAPSTEASVWATPRGEKLFCAAPAFAAALWLCTGAGAPAPAPAPAPAAASAEAPRREAARSWEELAADAECLRRCWGRAAHVDAWRDELGIAEASTPAAQQRDRRRRISGRLSAVARAGGALVRPMLVAAPLATATLALAALWAAGVLWPLLVRARLGAYAAAVGWAWLRLPAWTGWAFGQIITRFATFGHLIHTRTLAATPWLQRWPWRLHLRVHAEDFGFGNPPGFPHTFFVEARTVDVRVSCGLPDLWRWLFGVRVALPLAADPEYRGYGVFRVDVLECNGVTINFEMFRGEFNINGFERLLAQGAVRRKLRRGAPMPNMLRVGVGSAVGLNGGSLNLLTGERAIRPRVVLHVREHRLSTGTAARDTSPGAAPNAYSWGEELALPIDDPSAVLHVCVYDDTPGGESLLGQWVMTLKWLVIEPSWCEHSSLHVAADGAVRGWFVLSDGASASASASATPLLDTPRRLGVGECGELELTLRWSHEPDVVVPRPRLTALEQLTHNSAESSLRLGNPRGAQRYLARLPYLLDVQRVTVRQTSFFVKDLFMGHNGQAEAAAAEAAAGSGGGAGRTPESVQIDLLDFDRCFGVAAEGDAGVTVFDFLFRFFIKQAFPRVLDPRSPKVLLSALSQSSAGFVHSIHDAHRNFWREFAETLGRKNRSASAAGGAPAADEGGPMGAALAAALPFDASPAVTSTAGSRNGSTGSTPRRAITTPAESPPTSPTVALPPPFDPLDPSHVAAAPSSPRWPRSWAAAPAPATTRRDWRAALARLPAESLLAHTEALDASGEHRASAEITAAWLDAHARAHGHVAPRPPPSAPPTARARTWAAGERGGGGGAAEGAAVSLGAEAEAELAAWLLQTAWREYAAAAGRRSASPGWRLSRRGSSWAWTLDY